MRRLTAIHPFLFAIFPILSLFRVNQDMVNLRELVLPILIVALATVLLWLLARRFVGDGEAAGIVVSVFWLLFFSYASVRDTLGLTQDLPLIVVFSALCLLTAYGVKKQRQRMRQPALIMATVGLALVLMPTLTAIPGLVRPGGVHAAAPSTEVTPAASAERPDIYYIILDGYARGDVLEDIYGYDNSPFLDALASRGFYVAERSRPNYAQTYLSLASSLNLCYLDDVAARVGPDYGDRTPLGEMVQDNAAARFLKQHGYTYVTFSSGHLESELAHADVHMAARWSLSLFHNGVVNLTPLSSLRSVEYGLYRSRLLYALDHLQDAADLTPPVFVVAHILAPHPPFVFGEHGEALTPDQPLAVCDGMDCIRNGTPATYVDAYVKQLSFVNVKVLAAVDAILARSSRPPIIILQADHGPGSMLDWSSIEKTDMKERMSILNAYYLPGGKRDGLYAGITPVNTFPLIFNEYLGAGYEMLQDESYFSLYDRPYDFIPVPAPSS